MFRRLSEPLPLSEASLLALRPALNAPVLNVGFLPVGPARAAIVAFGEEWGGIGLALGIRSNEGGQVAVFRNQESIEPDVAVTTALEPILAEAERMGFLFDEDMVAAARDGTGRSQAMALWGRLMGELELPPAPRAAPPEPAANEPILVVEDEPSRAPLPPARPTTPDSPPPPGAQPASARASAAPPDTPPHRASAAPPDKPPHRASAALPNSPPRRASAAPPDTPSARAALPPASPVASSELVLEESVPELDLGTEGVVLPSEETISSGLDLSQETLPLLDESDAEAVGELSRRSSDVGPSARPAPTGNETAPPAKSVESEPPASATTPANGDGVALPQPKLSKFRHVDEAVEAVNETTADGANVGQLGRIPLVRVRRGGGAGKRASTFARLLSSF